MGTGICGRQEGERSGGKVKVERMSTTSTGHHRYNNKHHNRYKNTMETNSLRGEGLTVMVIHELDSEGCVAIFQGKKKEQRSGAEAWRSRRKAGHSRELGVVSLEHRALEESWGGMAEIKGWKSIAT